MAYHKLLNLGQVFQGDLSEKLTKDRQSMDFMDFPCNYN